MARGSNEIKKVRLNPAKLEEFKPTKMQKYYEEKEPVTEEPEEEAEEIDEFQMVDKPKRGKKQEAAQP